ncbi:MAG: NAD-dependent epimerase/dehydratase family protein [Flavipsychrobacter sp.]|nr:NAD-dependent epimerase/dehydratase family protein [Flavipsychrobacter sp.]
MSTGSNKKILVTGASGLLGRHLTRFLSAHGHQVRTLYNKHAPNEALAALPHVQWQQCDLLDIYDVEAAMEDVEDVYHCAAIVSFDPARHEEMLHFNSESTQNIVNQALENNIRKLVHVSSVAALGRTAAGKEITEEEEWQESGHNTAYGTAKYMAEMEVWRGMGEGLNAVVVNPGIILGAGNWEEGSAHLMQIAYKEFPFYTNGVTSFVDVADVVNIMYLLMESEVSAERFILSAGNYAYRDIFTLMALTLNKKPPRIEAGERMTDLVWRLSALKSAITGGKPYITKETAGNAQHKSNYNNKKILRFFPEYKYKAIEDTIKDMAQSFMQEIVKGN